MIALIFCTMLLLPLALGQYDQEASATLQRLLTTVKVTGKVLPFQAPSPANIDAFDKFVGDHIRHRQLVGSWVDISVQSDYTTRVRYMAMLKLTPTGDTLHLLKSVGNVTEVHASIDDELFDEIKIRPVTGFVYRDSATTYNAEVHKGHVLRVINDHFLKIWNEHNLGGYLLDDSEDTGKKFTILVGHAIFAGTYKGTDKGDYLLVSVDVLDSSTSL